MPDTPSKVTWGDEVSEELGDDLPPSTTVGPDENGIKTVTEYYVDDDGRKVKLVRRIKVKKITTKLNKEAALRKQWRKFGDAAGNKPGPDPSTTNVGEQMIIKLGIRQTNVEEEEAANPLDALKKKDKLVFCRICKGDHWTSRCPYKDSLGPLTEGAGLGADEPEKAESGAPSTPDKPGKYVPPSMRGDAAKRGAGKSDFPSRNTTRDDNCTIRVTNVSEDTRDSDLHELFRHFGSINRVFLARDKVTGASKGFAFITFATREDAAKAIQGLDGYGYDSLILHVEWAKPSAD